MQHPEGGKDRLTVSEKRKDDSWNLRIAWGVQQEKREVRVGPERWGEAAGEKGLRQNGSRGSTSCEGRSSMSISWEKPNARTMTEALGKEIESKAQR